MATNRRIVTAEKTHSDQVQPEQPSSIIAPAVPRHVIVKLLLFSFAMIVLPISSYFVTVDTIFSGNSTYAGATAAIIANVVLIGYVIVAMKEDQSERLHAQDKEKKSR